MFTRLGSKQQIQAPRRFKVPQGSSLVRRRELRARSGHALTSCLESSRFKASATPISLHRDKQRVVFLTANSNSGRGHWPSSENVAGHSEEDQFAAVASSPAPAGQKSEPADLSWFSTRCKSSHSTQERLRHSLAYRALFYGRRVIQRASRSQRVSSAYRPVARQTPPYVVLPTLSCGPTTRIVVAVTTRLSPLPT